MKILDAVGVWFYSSSTGRYLYLLRDDAKHPGTWGLPGGKVEAGEALLEAIVRECREEMGSMPDYTKILPIDCFHSPDGRFAYHTFFCRVDSEFQPRLNHEHLGYAWVNRGVIPRPLHPGLYATVTIEAIQAKIAVIEAAIASE